LPAIISNPDHLGSDILTPSAYNKARLEAPFFVASSRAFVDGAGFRRLSREPDRKQAARRPSST
jgi:hypothetical protein